jgi:hypothetical protein
MPKVIENDLKINLRAHRGVIFQFWGGFWRDPILDGFLIGKKTVLNHKNNLKKWSLWVRE